MVDNDMEMECEDCPKSDEEFPTPPVSCVSTTSVHNTTPVFANSNIVGGTGLLNATGWSNFFNNLQHNSSPNYSHCSSLSSASSSSTTAALVTLPTVNTSTANLFFEANGVGLTSGFGMHKITAPGQTFGIAQQQSAIGEALFTSPHNLVANGLLSPDVLGNQLIWDQWMCMLASTLTPPQWQAYWRAYASLFGVNALPTHLLSFFGDILSQNSTMEEDDVEQVPTEQSCSHPEGGLSYG